MPFATVQLTGTYQLPDGTPAKGQVEIIPSEKQILDDTGDVILSGRVKVQLDAAGHFAVDLPATDDVSLNPTGFGYTLAAKLHHTHLPAVSFSLPAAVSVVDVTDVTTVDPSTFTPSATYSAYVVAVEQGFVGTEDEWLATLVGPAGPTGPQGPQGPAGADGADGADGASTWSAITDKPTVFKPDVTDPDLTATFVAPDAKLDKAFAGMPLITYGHSFLAEQGVANPADYYARRLATNGGTTYPTLSTANDLKRAEGGSRVEQAAQRLVGSGGAPWVAGTRAVVLIQALINTARLHGVDPYGIAAARHGIRAMCAVVSSKQRIDNTDAMFTYTGGVPSTGTQWSGGTFNAGWSQITFTVPAAGCWFLTGARRNGLSGVTLAFTNESAGGAAITTFVNQDIGASDTVNTYTPAAIKLDVPAGTQVKVTASGAGTSLFDALLVPDTDPVPILLMKEPYLGDYSYSTAFPNGSDAALDAFNAVLDDVSAEFPNVIVADPNTAGYWEKAKALPGVPGALVQTDGVHPNEAGNLALYLTARDALRHGTAKYGLARSARLPSSSSTGTELTGTGSPEGVVAAAVGVTYVDTAATRGAVQWVKATGTGNTGWRVTYGDTGWRQVKTLLTNGWTAADVFMKRTQAGVEVRFGGLDSTPATATTLMAAVAGFTPNAGNSARGILCNAAASSMNRISAQPGTGFVAANSPTGVWYGEMFWTDPDLPWPTSLPGTAA